MKTIIIEVSDEVYDGLQRACDAPEHRTPRVDPDKPRRTIVEPKWDSPEDLIEKALEPMIAQIAGPYMAENPAVKTLMAQQQSVLEQIQAATKVVSRVRKGA